MQLGVKKDTLWIFWVAWISWLRSGLSVKTKKSNFQQFWLILGGVANISVQISFKKLIFRKFLSWNRFRRSLISTCPHTIQLPGTSKLEILLNWERAVFMVANYIFIKKEILLPTFISPVFTGTFGLNVSIELFMGWPPILQSLIKW